MGSTSRERCFAEKKPRGFLELVAEGGKGCSDVKAGGQGNEDKEATVGALNRGDCEVTVKH